RAMQAVRAIDPDHMLFLEGNRYSTEFDMFHDPLPNVVYTNHDYALAGFMDAGPYPGVSRGEHVDRDALEKKFVKRSEYMLEYDGCRRSTYHRTHRGAFSTGVPQLPAVPIRRATPRCTARAAHAAV